jgi:hypothetical protein
MVVPTERLAMVTRQGKDSLFIGSVDAWVDALRVARLVMYSLAERSL